MFLLNSCLGLFSAASCEALLLPKLRSHFAEFLNNTSSVGLRILSSSTCVGLRYGYNINNSGFSRRSACRLRYFNFAPHHAFGLYMGDLPPMNLLRLHRSLHSRLRLSVRVPTVLLYCSTGISTCCPSATPFGLVLGPDLPRADQLYSGNLGYSAVGILTLLSLLIPAFSLHDSPLLLTSTASSCHQCSSTNVLIHSSASVLCFSPGHFRRRTSRLVSYYALFE